MRREAQAIYEIRDPDSALDLILQSLWLQRVLPPDEETLPAILDTCIELLSQGEPIPSAGLVADVRHLVLARDRHPNTSGPKASMPNVPANLLSAYEDHVLGKLCADRGFDEAAEHVRRYAEGRDQTKGAAFILRQFRKRAGFAGAHLSPGILHGVRDLPRDEVLRRGIESLQTNGMHPILESLMQSLIKATRQVGGVLGREDVREIQLKTALDEYGERLALRQIIHAARRFEDDVPLEGIRPSSRREEVPTHVLDEDTYPVGGFASISNRGSVESLLYSQLAYIDDNDARPDLFDLKFLRGELLYYSRDENQFLRRRRTFVIAFFPDLVEQLRHKDAHLPYQHGVLLLALLNVAIANRIDRLRADALQFVILIPGGEHADDFRPERELLERLLRERIANQVVTLQQWENVRDLEELCSLRGRNSLCHCLTFSVGAFNVEPRSATVAQMRIAGSRPLLTLQGERDATTETEEDWEAWGAALARLLQYWT